MTNSNPQIPASTPTVGDLPSNTDPLPVALRGTQLLTNSMLNKGTAFTASERAAFGLEGLLPPHVFTLDEQLQRAYQHITRKADPLERYIGLVSLQDRNETLFYRLLLEHPDEFLPIVYTPTVGLACQKYSHIYRRPRGLWITPAHRGHIHDVLANWPQRGVRLIVVTDNERILGLGDQGAGGMGIPIGKCALYTLAAGIHPSQVLPISLDVGTDNLALRNDPLYLGWPEPRLRGAPYDALVEEFVMAVQRCFPAALLQWEDFKKSNAMRLLERYRHRVLSFNDDIQGTAAIGAAALLAATRATATPLTRQRIVLVGAGAAGLGIARQIRYLLEKDGLRGDDMYRAILMLDSGGLLHQGRQLDEPSKQEFAWPLALAQSQGLPLDHPDDLDAIVRAYRPTVLLGTTGQPGLFTQSIVQTMAQHVRQPVILPLSNPTSQSEGVPADLIAWTQGQALIATGSPFDSVPWQGRMIPIRQANNVFVFPGVGLGVFIARARQVTEGMFAVAAAALADAVSPQDLAAGALFPPLTDLRRVAAQVAQAVVRQAVAEGVGTFPDEAALPAAIAAAMWTPCYQEYVPIKGQ